MRAPAPPPRPPLRAALRAVGALLAVLPGSAGATQENHCATCHPDVARAEAGRPHAREGISCTSCHGGDSSRETKEAAKAPSTGFRATLTGIEAVETCGNCHADVVRMNPYGLATDQLAQYRTSRHGQALFGQEDSRVATCVSCHGAHGVLGPESNESPVHPTHVAETCGRCHGDASLMDAFGLDTDAPKAWKASVHAAALANGDLSAPQCATCHGSHGAVPPGFGSVGAVCGKCHVRERELFGDSPHAPLVELEEFPGCETCHSNHEVRPAELGILDRMCELCHGGDDVPLQTRDRILASLSSTRELLATTKGELDLAAQHGLATAEDRLLVQEASTDLEAAQVVQHALDADRLAETTDEAKGKLEMLSARLSGERERARLKRLSTIPVVGFLLLMSLGFWIRHRRIHRHGGGAVR